MIGSAYRFLAEKTSYLLAKKLAIDFLAKKPVLKTSYLEKS
ncbi:hypothetical protein BARBAKC583_1171 [Bartonella bacilliformis KC583]|uniref:Uncharacterized protein n=1 Tax=Bartonella bacilliformis (strain ATCC 35685 / KC583 / Herrer 020/F12,63) TaxID=360095 RepID=A1UTX6_BARBK|nr:hypothetical protein BARBAKC583_1171 [Bartonella bacilliformis KC583]